MTHTKLNSKLGSGRRPTRPIDAKAFAELACTDPNAARFLAMVLSHDESLDSETRRRFMCASLGVTETELERCVEALASSGLVRVEWLQ